MTAYFTSHTATAHPSCFNTATPVPVFLAIFVFRTRFGFGDDGQPLAEETVVQRGRCVFDTRGNMTIHGVVYSHSSADDATAAAANTAFQEAFDNATADLRHELGQPDPVSERFSVDHKRLHTHINSFNPVIAFAVRSNMDIKVLLKGSDAKWLLYYILNYATKTKQTLDVLLPLLVPVVERIRADSGDAPEKEMAVRLERSCLCKQLSSLPIGGPAAASKVLGLSDEKLSHGPVPCPMTPLLTWASKRDTPADADNSPGDDSDSSSGSYNDADDSGAIITPFQGKLTVAQRTHLLYRSRCRPDDTEHPLHQKFYFAWCRKVRIEKCPTLHGRPRGKQPSGRCDYGDHDDVDDDYPGDECLDDDSVSPSGRTPSTRAPRRGRPRATRYDLVGEYRNKWEQVSFISLQGFLCCLPFSLLRPCLLLVFSLLRRFPLRLGVCGSAVIVPFFCSVLRAFHPFVHSRL